MEKPRRLDFDITLLTADELNSQDVKEFLLLVRDFGPKGILEPYSRTYSDGTKANIFIVMSVLEDGYQYKVPLKRNLIGDEAEAIVVEWAKFYDKDFDIEATSPVLRMQDLSMFDEVDIDENYEMLAHTVENSISHQRWMTDKVNEGWRYGMTQSSDDKVCPFLMPWEQLSESAKTKWIDNYANK